MVSPAAPDLSVLLMVKRPGAEFAELLRSLAAQVDAPRFEIIAVDSGSPDETLRLLDAAGARVERIAPASFGHGRSRNLAASLARGRVIVFLTQDAVPADPSFLAKLVAPLADPAVAGVAARQVPPAEAEPLLAAFLALAYPDASRRLEPGRVPAFGVETVWFSNVASAIRREVWQAIPFRDVVMSEDQWFAHDVLRAGRALVYEPRACVVHHQRMAAVGLFRRNFDSAASLRGLPFEALARAVPAESRFILGLLARLCRQGRGLAAARVACLEAARVAGFSLGKLEPLLPAAIKRRASQLPWFWN